MAEDEKVVSVPRPSRGQRLLSLALLLVSAGLLYYAWWGWTRL